MAFTIPQSVPDIKSDNDFEHDLYRLAESGQTLGASKLTAVGFLFQDGLSLEQVHLAEQLNSRADEVVSAFAIAAETPTLLGIAHAQQTFASLKEVYRDFRVNTSQEEIDEELSRLIDAIEDCEICLTIVTDQLSFLNAIIDNNTAEPPVLPDIRPAPIQAVIKDNILSLTGTQNRIGSIDYPSVNRTREALRRILEDVVDDLRSSSNADRKYIRLCERLLATITSPIENISIEDLGVQCQLVERSTRRLADELGAIVLDQIQHVLAGTNVLLNQFEEWRKFLDEQARTNLNPEDGAGLVAQAAELIAELEKPGAPVEPELVRRLRGMVEPALTGIVGADTVAIPLVCSLSNIFSSLSQHAIAFYQSVPADHQHAVAASAVALLAKFAVDLIEKFCPVLSRYQPLTFIIGVARYLLPLFAMIKDVTS